MSYDVHGVYPDDVDDLSKEAYLEMYLKETNPIICESDDEFINMCKQIKGKWLCGRLLTSHHKIVDY